MKNKIWLVNTLRANLRYIRTWILA